MLMHTCRKTRGLTDEPEPKMGKCFRIRNVIDMFRTLGLCRGSTLTLKDHLAEFIRTLNIKVVMWILHFFIK